MSKMGSMSDIRYGAIRSRRMLIEAVKEHKGYVRLCENAGAFRTSLEHGEI